MKKQVSFKNQQIVMAGELYCPEGFDERIKYPAVVVTHLAGAVKEQSPAVYAQKLSQYGIIVLTFDASHQGASGGEPRLLENPTGSVEDIRSAVDYLTTLPFIDRKRIGAFGICAGGGYSINAAQTERRIKAVAGVSTTDAGAAIREGWTGGTPVSEQIKLAGSKADSLYLSERAYEKAATCEKELFIIQGATHVALYDVPEYAGQAVLKLAEFFGKNL